MHRFRGLLVKVLPLGCMTQVCMRLLCGTSICASYTSSWLSDMHVPFFELIYIVLGVGVWFACLLVVLCDI